MDTNFPRILLDSAVEDDQENTFTPELARRFFKKLATAKMPTLKSEMVNLAIADPLGYKNLKYILENPKMGIKEW